MSIPVAPADLRAACADFGSAYLLSTSSPRVKVVTVDPEVAEDGSVRVVGPGRGTLANLAVNAAVTLVFPPHEHHGYSLLVDGQADVEGDDVVITVEHAVLHRPAAHAEGPVGGDGCGQDCAPVG
ncbi:pyridoxamine 5'-phosphate oxidase [Nocardioides daejeonensis]|uniref:pyridoxamine 5'-phosphate oxidase n=1 Tax=Nocardioides daejeonensis TaxID=1046556 RepID=UPI000D747EE4|nr:pyridoxamine 5'-phosphate oxidase [Nocardioides daejeonensis]